MNKTVIKFIQTQLNVKGINAGPVDGILGPQTISALSQIDQIPTNWTNKRKATAFIQILSKGRNIEVGKIDGYWGPQTDYAFNVLQHLIETGKQPDTWRPEDLPEENPNGWPQQTTDEKLIEFYGNVGDHQKTIELPYQHKLAWDKRTIICKFQCHEKVYDSLGRILSGVLDSYGIEEIKRLGLDLWGGCLNVRIMRGGSRYSMHSWGIAVDYDPERNQLKWGRDRSSFAKSDYYLWWKLWEEEGWISLGRQRNFDWMHVQAAKL